MSPLADGLRCDVEILGDVAGGMAFGGSENNSRTEGESLRRLGPTGLPLKFFAFVRSEREWFEPGHS